MKRDFYLSLARQAVSYVMGKMTIGAANKIGDVLSSFGGSLLCVPAIRSVDIATPRDAIPNWLQAAAAKAEHVGCGNCGEQAALAYVFLYRMQVRPIDYMYRTNADHAFVVVGRAQNSLSEDYSTWGIDAVICDPWDGKAYSASEIPLKMYGGGVFEPRTAARIN